MALFDSREYLEALRPPEFVAPNGTRYRGKLLSVDEWQPFEERLRAAQAGQLVGPALHALLRDLTSAMFPRDWRFWKRSCWQQVKRLPPVGQLRAVYTFLQSQGEALGVKTPTLSLETRTLLGLPPVSDGDSSPSAGSSPAS